MRASRVLGILILALMISSAVAGSALASKNHGLFAPSTPVSGQWFDYVLNIMLENHSINFTYYNGAGTSSCIGNCTYFTGLANANAFAEGLNLGNIQSPSAGAYVAITSAYRNTPQNCNNGPNTSGCPYLQIANIVDRLDKAGLSWKAYIEGYPQASGCVDSWFDTGPNYYAPIHNPFVYYSDIHNNSTRCNRIVNANSVDINQNACWPTALPTDDLLLKDLNNVTNASNYMFLTPNLIDDAHNCNDVSASNAWLQKIVPQILGSTLFKTRRAAVFVTFDEPGCTDPSGQPPCPSGASSDMYSVWASNPSNPTTKIGYKSVQPYTLYSPLKAVESNWNLASFNTNDGTASSMAEFFGSPLKANFGYSPSSPQVGQTVTFSASPTGGVFPYSFSWTFGDGGTSTSNPATHSYTTAGSYKAKLNVTDKIGTNSNTTQVLRVGPDFNTSSILANLIITLGSSNTTTINLASLNGFSGTVTLSTSVAPSGLLATLNPSSVSLTSGGTGSSTLTVSSSTPGNYAVNVTGISGSISHNTIVTVNAAAPDFSVSSSPSSLTIQSSNSGSSTIAVNSLHQFSGTVLVSASVSPLGLNASLVPTSLTVPASGSSTSTLIVSSVSTSPIGAYNITVTGTNGTLTHQTILPVTLVPPSLTVASDSALGVSSLYTAGGQKLIQDSAGRMISIYVDTAGRIGLSYANADPTIGGWSTPIKSPTPSSAYSWPAAVLVSLSSLRIISGGGSGSGIVSDIPVTIQRDSQNNITGFTFGTATTIDSSGIDRYPTAILSHNGDILVAWAWQNTTRSLVKFLRWDPSTGWKNTSGTSTTPDILLNSVNVTWFVPTMIERPDNHNIYLLANRFTGPPSTIAFVKATWNGSTWSWGVQNLLYETNASDADDDPVGLVWDPTKSLVVAQYGITSTHTYGVFTLSAADVKTHTDTPNLAVAADRGWAGINVQNQTGDYYLFLISVSSDGGPGPLGFIRMPSGGAWNATIIWLNTATDNEVTSLRVTGPSTTLDLLYDEGTTSPTLVKFVRVNPPNFSVTATPGTLTTQSGSNAASTITISSVFGFNGTVNLSATSSPSGLTFSLSPTTVTLTRAATATSILTFSPIANGTYNITVTGTSGPFSQTTTVIVTVTDFTITANPTAVTIAAHALGNSTITVTAVNGFTGLVSLGTNSTSCTVSPSTITGSGSTALSCNFSSGRIVHVIITGASGFLTHNTIVTYTVQDFSITSSPTIVNVNLGTTGTSTITITGMFGYSGVTNLSTNSTTCSLAPTSTTGNGISTLSCSSLTVGTFHVNVNGTSGTISHSSVVTFNVQDFQITANPTLITVPAGSGGTSTITITSLNGFAGTANLSTNSTACMVSPSSVTGPGSSTLSCSFPAATTVTVVVTGTSGSLIHRATVTFTVTDFALTANPSSLTVNAGSTGTSTVTLTPVNGFGGVVSFSSNSTACTISPSTVNASGSTTLSCTFPSALTDGVVITGTSGALAHTTVVTYTVQDFSIATTPTTIMVSAGSAGTSSVSVASLNGFAGLVNLSTNSSSACTVSPNSLAGSGSATLSCTFSSASTVHVTITGTSFSLTHSVTVTYTVQDFNIVASPTAVSVIAESSGTSLITVTGLNGFAGPVSLATNSTSCSVSPTSVTGSGSSTLSCTFLSGEIVHVGVTGTNALRSHSATVTYTVQDFTITATPIAVNVNVNAHGTSAIAIAAENGFVGRVDLATNSTSCTLSPTRVTGSGSSTLTCTFNSTGIRHVLVTGTSGSLIHPVNVTFAVQDFTLIASPPNINVNINANGTSTIGVGAVTGFAGPVTLTSNNTSCSLSPTSVASPGNSTLSCKFTSTGNTAVGVTGTSTSLSHSVTVTFVVQDFTLAVNPSSVTVKANSPGTSMITVGSVNGFANIVNLASNSTSCTIAPISITASGSATLSCTSSSGQKLDVRVSATNGTLVHTADILYTVQDFTVTASPTSITVTTGTPGTSMIAVTSIQNFSGTVSLTDTISPSNGLGCTLSPTKINLGASGTSTLSCSGSAGSYTVTVAGTNASLVRATSVTYTIQDFTVMANPTSVNVNVNAPGTSTITVTGLNGFVGNANLATNNTSACSVTPTIVTGSGSATLSCTFMSTGNKNVSVTGTSGSISHSVTVIFVVQDFSIFANPTSNTSNAGTTATSTITIAAVNGFAGVVTLADTAPSGLTCGAIMPTNVTGSGTATVSCGASVAGNYTLSLTGSSGVLSHSLTVLVIVQDYTINASPASLEINAGSTGSSTIIIAPLNHFSGTVSLSASGTSGLTLALSPLSLSGGSGTAMLTFSSSTAGNYTATVISSNSTLTHTITIMVQVVDFSIGANPATITIPAGAMGKANATVTALNRFSGTVNLILNPSLGLTATIAPNSIAGSGTATIFATASVSGDYSITIQASSATLGHSFGIIIHVVDYSLSGSPTRIVSPIASNVTSTLTLQSLNAYAGNVSLTESVQIDSSLTPTSGGGGPGHVLMMAPPAILPIVSINPQSLQLFSAGTKQCTISISLPSDLAAGNYRITITASDGTLSHAITLTVVATDFSMSGTPNSDSIPPGSNATILLNLQSLNFFRGNVTLTVTSTVAGPTGTLSTSTVQLTPNSNTNLNLTIHVPPNTAPGNYTITVQAVSGTISHTVNFPVTVTTGQFATVLGAILGPRNSNSIQVVTLFTLFTIFATLKTREYSKRKPSLIEKRSIKNQNIRGLARCGLLSYSPILLTYWRSNTNAGILTLD